MKKGLVIFASGSGSNAVNLCQVFRNHPQIEVKALFCNNAKAGVIEKMKAFDVPVVLFNRETFRDENAFMALLQPFHPDAIALLGFLWQIPPYLIQKFPRSIINLHPALLPKFGGKGMYGHHVHEAVIAAGEKESGITLHRVNEHYDEGETLAQFSFPIENSDTAEVVAAKVHALEQRYVPKVIEDFTLHHL